ncbi:Rad51 domain-containing protein [Favolaschia claudopus]|uniref:Rad51 domain-containing protein n=1 Tax=Favolaschia claudopus TaxID=2862362 RepID=A0AAW0D1N2_9AGAR
MDRLSQLTSRPLSSLAIPPSTLSALIRAGYETVQDLDTSNAEKLAKDLSIPLPSSQALFSQTKTQTRTVPLSQPASAALSSSSSSAPRIATTCSPLDKLLGGGLLRKQVLEISGPPGTPKAAIVMCLVRSFVKSNPDEQYSSAGYGTSPRITDTQNMTTASALQTFLPNAVERIFHHVLHTLPELVVFIRGLPQLLYAHPKIGLLVLSSLHFPLQASKKLSLQLKNSVLDSIKKALVQATARGVTVVITTQLATKLQDAEGSPANFDTGSHAVLGPQLAPTYLPPAKSFRVLICPQARDSGVLRLLSEPSKPKEDATPKEESYIIPKRRMLPESN